MVPSTQIRRGLVCFFCDEEGHKKYDCPKYLARQGNQESVRPSPASGFNLTPISAKGSEHQ